MNGLSGNYFQLFSNQIGADFRIVFRTLSRTPKPPATFPPNEWKHWIKRRNGSVREAVEKARNSNIFVIERFN